MKITVDLSGEKFDDYDSVDFYDGKTIFWDVPTHLPSDISFKVWGATIPYTFKWEEYVEVSSGEGFSEVIQKSISEKSGVVIRGFGEFKLEKVLGGQISILPLDMTVKQEYTFFKDRKNNLLQFKRQWNLDSITKGCYKYLFDADIAFPYGGCELLLYAEGKAKFSFRTEDCVSYHDYLLNPNRRDTFWGYMGKEEASTYSFEGFEI